MLRQHPLCSTLCAVTCSLAAMLFAAGSTAGEPHSREPQLGESRPLTIREMATAYRVQAYLKHYQNRETYQLHRKAAGEMLARWKAAGSPETADVVAWFQNARQAAITGQMPPQALELAPLKNEKLVESKPQPGTKPAPHRTRPASITKPAEVEAANEALLPSPEPIVPSTVYQEGEKPSESTETKPEEAPASPVVESEGESDGASESSPSKELEAKEPEANDSEASATPDQSSARKETNPDHGTVQSTVKALLRAVLPERE